MQHKLLRPFREKFSPSYNSRNGQQGSVLSFGDVDNSLYQGQIYWTPVTSQTYWQIGIQGFVLFSKKKKQLSRHLCKKI